MPIWNQFWEPQDTDPGEERLFAKIGFGIIVAVLLILGFVLGPHIFN